MRVERVFGTIIQTTPKSVAYVEFFKAGKKWIALGTSDDEILKKHGIDNPLNKSITNTAEEFAKNSYTKLNEYLASIGEGPIDVKDFYTVEYWPSEEDPDGRPHPEYYLITFEGTFEKPKWQEIPTNGNERKEKVLERIFSNGRRPRP